MKAVMTKHGKERLIKTRRRLEEHGVVWKKVGRCIEMLFRQKFNRNKDYAVKIKDVGTFIGESDLDCDDGDESNGQVLWSVVRKGEIVNFMFRRRNQPEWAERFSVDEVRELNCR